MVEMTFERDSETSSRLGFFNHPYFFDVKLNLFQLLKKENSPFLRKNIKQKSAANAALLFFQRMKFYISAASTAFSSFASFFSVKKL